MKEIANTYLTYGAIDGRVFRTKAECRAYEDALPRVERLVLEKPYLRPLLDKNQEGVWTVEQETWTTSTEYEPPGFLREGGDRSVHHRHTTVCGHYRGRCSDVLTYLVADDDWWARRGGKIISLVQAKVVPAATPAPVRP